MEKLQKVKIKKTEEQEELESKNLRNTLYVRLTEQVYKRIFKIAKETNSNMSEVARLCIESKLFEVERLYREISELRNEFSNK